MKASLLSTILLLCACLTVTTFGCWRTGTSNSSNGLDSSAQPDASSDVHFLDASYQQALDLYKTGAQPEAVRLLQRATSEAIRLAPDSVLEDPSAYDEYVARRLVPAVRVLRHVSYENETYAVSLISRGQLAEGADLLRINMAVARQLMNSKPPSAIAAIQATSVWCRTFEAFAKAMEQSGAPANHRAALESHERAWLFSKTHLVPLIEEADREWGIHSKATVSEAEQQRLEREYVLAVGQFVERWNKEVDTPPYNDLPLP